MDKYSIFCDGVTEFHYQMQNKWKKKTLLILYFLLNDLLFVPQYLGSE